MNLSSGEIECVSKCKWHKDPRGIGLNRKRCTVSAEVSDGLV